MSIDAVELGRRLRLAREAAGMTQAEVAEELGLSRPSMVQLEAGQRSIGALELERFVRLYGRDLSSIFEEEADGQAALPVLLRASPDIEASRDARQALVRCVDVAREIAALESLLGLPRGVNQPPLAPSPAPRSKGEAIEQARACAENERRRLRLGDGPIHDLAEVLEMQGVRVAQIELPSGVSGLTLNDVHAGLVVAINGGHVRARQQFSLAHEYAHVLFDRERVGVVSRASETDNLIEVRANAFAGSFLVPDSALVRLLAAQGRGGESRQVSVVPTGDDRMKSLQRVEARPRQSQAVQLTDIALVAHVFGVSPQTALFRLRNLRPSVMTDAEFDALKERVDAKEMSHLRRVLRMQEPDGIHAKNKRDLVHASHRLITLGLDALREELITRARFRELALLGGLADAEIRDLLDSSGIDEPPVPARRPRPRS